jgi:hypothetical protein
MHSRTTLTAVLSMAAIAAGTFVAGGSAAQADQHLVDIRAAPNGPSSHRLISPVSLVGAGALVPGSERHLEISATFDFSNVANSVVITQEEWEAERCTLVSGPRYVCSYSVPPRQHEHFVFSNFTIQAKDGVAWATRTVPVSVAIIQGASDPDTSNNSINLTLDIRSNLADVKAEHSGGSYRYVGRDCCGLQVRVTAPNPLDSRRLAATFDISEVAHVVNARTSSSCTMQSATRYRCERPANRYSDALIESYIDLGLSAKAGAPAGPAGRVRVDVEQVGGVDPDLSNNRIHFTIDINDGTGQRVRVDVGEASGRIGDTVRVPATLINLGPNTVDWMGTTLDTWDPGLEVVRYEGCAGTSPLRGGVCDTGRLVGGADWTVHAVIKITGCPNPFPQYYRASVHVSSSSTTFLDGRSGGVRVAGCPGGSAGGSGSGAGDASGPAGPEADWVAEVLAIDDPSDPGDSALPAAGSSQGPVAAEQVPRAGGGEWAPASRVQSAENGMGLAGVVALLVLVAAARAARWTVLHGRPRTLGTP